jgi:Flp pilus assembly pilin Flp
VKEGIVGQIWHRLRRRLRDDGGASLVEYALLIGLLAIVCFSALQFLGTRTSDSLQNDCKSIQVAQGAPATNCGP